MQSSQVKDRYMSAGIEKLDGSIQAVKTIIFGFSKVLEKMKMTKLISMFKQVLMEDRGRTHSIFHTTLLKK